MTATFTATEAAVSADEEGFLFAGVGRCGTKPWQYLNFQRGLPIGGADDEGVHLEYNDQVNSGYDKIKTCLLARERLRVELTEPIDSEGKYTAVDVELRLGEDAWVLLADGLRKIFAGREAALDVRDG